LKQFIKRLKEIVDCLPENIPISSGNNTLAAFSFEPALLNDPKISSDDLWEAVINRVLKEHLGWGVEVDMGELSHCGEQGMEGVLQFSQYFVEKCDVSMDLFEGKLTSLLCAAEALSR
ncbi:hypothetical protein K443DRAFT_628814, partial [Laccaria amethystina LaAM-08-1]